MKKSSVYIIAVLLFLTALSLYVYFTKSTHGNANERSREFAFKDTASITRIFIADKEGNKSDIARTKNGWMVNGKFVCRSDAVLNLLEAIKNVEVKMSVPKDAKPGVIRFMASGAIKVEIYEGDKMVRQYYVGHETPDSQGSYMLLTDPETGKNFENPYVCFIPGFIGYLLPRFIANENEWRDRVVLNYIPPQLKEVKLTYPQLAADSSFAIELKSTTEFGLYRGDGKEIPFETARMKQYLIYLQNISYEALITGKNKRLEDSLSASPPFCVLSVTTNNFKTDVFRMYRLAVRPDVAPDKGVTYDFNPDRFYLRFGNDKEWAVAQYYVFGKLLVTPQYFSESKSVKK